MIELLNIDCVEYMIGCEDNSFDLAIVDPPYGVGETWKKDRKSKFAQHRSTYKNNKIPGRKYFNQLFRVSKNQIIWGGNYYTRHLPPRNNWIVWDKKRDYKTQHLAEGELAWHSHNEPLRIFSAAWNGFIRCQPRYGVHPHEKPVLLYDWILFNYAAPGMKILDTHLGSGSSAIAAHNFGCSFVGCEKDKEYFNAANERFLLETRQTSMMFTR